MSNTTRRFLMAASGAGGATYIDDVFSTYVYIGDETARTIPTGVDNTKGALAWVKSRNDTHNHHLVDTERGANKILQLYSNATDAESTIANRITGFTNNGFNLGSAGQVNGTNAYRYVGWNFRKSKGFFDCIKYTGTGATSGSPQTIGHSLKSIPGMIIIKNLTQASQWFVYHVGLGEDKFLQLNKGDAAVGYNGGFTNITSSSIGVFDSNSTNTNEFIAYVFAGGASTATGASSCSFNGTSGLDVAASSSVNLGTGTFCLECWVYLDNAPGSGSPSYARVFQLDGPTGNSNYNNLQVTINPSNNTLHAWAYGGGNPVAIVGNVSLLTGWHHIAVVRDSNNTITQYVDGYADGTANNVTTNFNPNSGSPRMRIGYYSSGNGVFDGKISNLRVTVGEPVYTGNFIPSPIPLTTSSQVTTSSNVKLLCCNDISNATGSTVTPGAISNNGTNPVAYGNNPFDDPEGFKFGKNEDQGVVKCGRYIGNGASDGPEINLGWEPQWILIKHNSGENWVQFDSMRGVVSDDKDIFLVPNSNASEDYGGWWLDFIDFTSTGFKIKSNYNIVNQNNGEYLFLAIRRPDGLVGKLPEAGTDAFNVVYGNSSSIIPNFPSNFPVDMGIYKQPATAYSWYLHTRLTGNYNIKTDSSDEQRPSSPGDTDATFDSPTGWGKFGYNTDKASWMWKRYAGFDVVTDKGDGGTTKQIAHGLGVVPEMIWRKNRDNSVDKWQVYHMGLNGGTNPYLYRLYLNDSNAEMPDQWTWTNAPTDTYFTVGANGAVNRNTDDFVTMLFASVDGISSVGSYSPSSSSTTVTCGFQPRFVIVKAITKDNTWSVADSLRGMTAANDPALALNENWENDKYGGADWIDVSATGFTVNSTGGVGTADANSNGETYIYYAHA